jgi:serine/threonine-protein kinase RsbW
MGKVDSNGNTISIPSSLDFIATVDEFLEGWLRQRNIPEDSIADMAIAVTELVNNAIKHGNKNDSNKKVTVFLSYVNGEARAVISDEGKGFNPESIPNPVAEENLLKEIGRGIFIVKSLMDDVRFSFHPGKGTSVAIFKKIA